MDKKRYLSKAEAKRLLAAIKDPKLKNMATLMLGLGVKADATYGEVGARLAAMRKRSRHKCQQCDKSFVGITTAKFCSNACRQKAKYQRGKDE